jgi:DNA-binding NarL/FixJ family response regulator
VLLRKENSALLRDSYVGRLSDRRYKATELSQTGLSHRSIAEELGVTGLAVHGYLKK